MEIPSDLKYTKDHEWVRIAGDEAVVGITEFAQSELGDIVYVELPKVGKTLKQKDQLCVVESTKAASEVFSPIGGTVKEANTALAQKPELINQSPYGDGWIARLSGAAVSELGTLMSADEYGKLIGA